MGIGVDSAEGKRHDYVLSCSLLFPTGLFDWVSILLCKGDLDRVACGEVVTGALRYLPGNGLYSQVDSGEGGRLS